MLKEVSKLERVPQIRSPWLWGLFERKHPPSLFNTGEMGLIQLT